MVLVDIYIPSLDKTYDFRVEEAASVGNLTAELVEMIQNETRSQTKFPADKFLLCSLDQHTIFNQKSSLRSCGIKNGSHLMLV